MALHQAAKTAGRNSETRSAADAKRPARAESIGYPATDGPAAPWDGAEGRHHTPLHDGLDRSWDRAIRRGGENLCGHADDEVEPKKPDKGSA